MQASHPVIKNQLLDDILAPERMVFIINPVAGTRLQRRLPDFVERHLNHKKFTYGLWYTKGPGHAAELTRQALTEGYKYVVAVGGDGSVNEVASVLMNTDAVLGIIPAGSGNGLAMHLGYGRDVEQAVRKLNHAHVADMDCGMLNGRPFFNIAGVGFDGLVSNRMKGRHKRGFLTYFLKSVEAGLQYASRDCVIEMENRRFSGKCFAISIANGPMYGYNFQIAPDARIDDGVFSVVVLKDAPKWQYFAAVPVSLQGKIYDASFVEHFSSARLRILSEGESYVHIDGEGLVLNGPIDIEVRPRCLKILVPEGFQLS